LDAFPQGVEYVFLRPLLETSGLEWNYQPRSTLHQILREGLVLSHGHYREGSKDKIYFPFYLFLAGVGPGKSRHASEFHKTAVESLNDVLQKKLKDAWVFHVCIENGTSLREGEEEVPFAAIGTRMPRQLLPDLKLEDVIR
jgi:hypothetical protein